MPMPEPKDPAVEDPVENPNPHTDPPEEIPPERDPMTEQPPQELPTDPDTRKQKRIELT